MKIIQSCLALCVLICALYGNKDRSYVSLDSSLSKNSDWEGVYGEFSQCDPTDIIPVCHKQKGLVIYDCIDYRDYHYEDTKSICSVGMILHRIPDPANPTEHLICATNMLSANFTFKILIQGNEAIPHPEYYEQICDEVTQECKKNTMIRFLKEQNGISISTAKGIDGITCETPIDNTRAGSLSGFYPHFKTHFACENNETNPAKKMICNDFYALNLDYDVYILYDFIAEFGTKSLQKSAKTIYETYQREITLECTSKQQEVYANLQCLYKKINMTIKTLQALLPKVKKISVKFHSKDGLIPIYEDSRITSNVMTSIRENDTYNAFLAQKEYENDFAKVIFFDTNTTTNLNQNNIIGFIPKEFITKGK